MPTRRPTRHNDLTATTSPSYSQTAANICLSVGPETCKPHIISINGQLTGGAVTTARPAVDGLVKGLKS